MWISRGATTILIYRTRVHQLRQKYHDYIFRVLFEKREFSIIRHAPQNYFGTYFIVRETKVYLEVIGSCVSTSRIRMTDCGVLEILLRRRSNHCPATA